MQREQPARQLYRSRDNRQLAGVSGGLGEYFVLDPTLVRVGWIVLALTTGPLVPLAYLLLAAIMPNAPADADTFSI